jgi:hypothetical protein
VLPKSPASLTPLFLLPRYGLARWSMRKVELERRRHVEALDLLVGQAAPDAACGESELVVHVDAVLIYILRALVTLFLCYWQYMYQGPITYSPKTNSIVSSGCSKNLTIRSKSYAGDAICVPDKCTQQQATIYLP